MDRWDVVLLIAAGWIAVMSLVRLMTTRRNEVVAELRQQIADRRAAEAASSEEAA